MPKITTYSTERKLQIKINKEDISNESEMASHAIYNHHIITKVQ